MDKLQIIYKKDDAIIADFSFECSELKNISLNNIPYYLTIQYQDKKISFEYSYLNHYDIRESRFNDINIKYGIKTGRLYEFELLSDISDIDNRKWQEIRKEVSHITAFKEKEKSDFNKFLKLILNLIKKSNKISNKSIDSNIKCLSTN